jgi:hypothetical protein
VELDAGDRLRHALPEHGSERPQHSSERTSSRRTLRAPTSSTTTPWSARTSWDRRAAEGVHEVPAAEEWRLPAVPARLTPVVRYPALRLVEAPLALDDPLAAFAFRQTLALRHWFRLSDPSALAHAVGPDELPQQRKEQR